MNLTERKREEYRSRIMQRIGAVLVCMSLLLATVFPPQPAKAAFVADDMAVAAIAAVFLASCGMTFAAQGMDSTGVKDQVGVLIDQYLNTMMGGKSALEWFGDVAIGYNRGMMVLPSAIANKLADFARWVKGEYNVEAGMESKEVYNGSLYYLQLHDGSSIELSICSLSFSSITSRSLSHLGYLYSENPSCTEYILKNGCRFVIKESAKLFDNHNARLFECIGNVGGKITTFARFPGGEIAYCVSSDNGETFLCYYDVSKYLSIDSNSSSLLLNSASAISIPDTIPADKEVAISTGAAATSYDDALAQILDAIAAGELSATKEIADAGTITDDPAIPIEETVPDVGELGLPALGETLTTRFPFSIPWDVVRAIKLLAAPAKTPRFEVDFFAPVRYRFGGKLGNTTVVLDFSEYEIIGQVSRWASTIGFCLLLASGTKKLIWTA